MQTAFSPAYSAKLIAEMISRVMQMAEGFSQMLPRLLNGAFFFFKFTKSFESFFNERTLNLKSSVALEERNRRLRDVIENNHMLKD